jgi:type VI secretion system protein ImpG
MDDLLPHYERELGFLRRHAREFAERYPKIATRLSMSGETCEDPHVERMIESFALLAARVHKKLDDEFPEITETLLGVLYPHYLRPFPSCSIARFDAGGAEAQLSEPVVVPRRTLLSSRQVKGMNCRFRTVFEVTISPMRIAEATFEEPPLATHGYRPPTDATSAITIVLESIGQNTLARLLQSRLRVFVDGEPSLVCQLREAIVSRRVGIAVESGRNGRWDSCPDDVILEVGFDPEDGMLDYDRRSLLAYRLLTEFFAYPEKFNFLDFDLAKLSSQVPAGTTHLRLKLFLRTPAGGDDARLLPSLSPANLLLGCTPVINLFSRPADPIRLTQTRSSYPVVVDSRRAYAFELYSIDSVVKIQKTVAGESQLEYRPFYALRHGDNRKDAGRFWHLKRDAQVAKLSPGYEHELSIIDFDFDTREERTETLSIEVTCTNRDLPSQLPYGLPGGDLTMEGGSIARSIRLLRKPTPPYRFDDGENALWRLISHLSLNHLSLAEGGLESLKETFSLYDITHRAANRRCIDGLVAIAYRPAVTRVDGNPFPTFVKGIEIELTVDEEAYVGIGLNLFVSVLDHFFGLFVHANSFVRLILRSAKTGEILRQCEPRSGDTILV